MIKKRGSGDSKLKQIASSTGRLWTQTLEQLTAILDGEERKVRTSPLSYKKKVVFFGSSSTEGSGTTDKETKPYHRLLAAKLAGGDYVFYNRGVGGDNTTGAIARFYNDVAPINADFVFLAFTLGNEGIYTATTAAGRMDVYKKFKAGILKLCHMIQQQGAVPIVMTQAPTNSFTTEIYDYARKLNAELETVGIHCCDWSGAVDAMDGTGKPIASIMTADGIHYIDAAHVEIGNSIPPTLFDRANLQSGGYLPTFNRAISTGALTAATPITYAPTDLTTYTIGVRFNVSALLSTSILSFGVQDKINLTTAGKLDLSTFATGVLLADNIVPDGGIVVNKWYHLAVSFNAISKEIRVYLDGVLKLTKANTALPITLLTVGGRAGTTSNLKNSFIKDVVVYRTRLTDDKVKAVFEGIVSQTSLEIYSPLHDKVLTANNNLINLAPTSVNLKIDPTETALTSVSSTTV